MANTALAGLQNLYNSSQFAGAVDARFGNTNFDQATRQTLADLYELTESDGGVMWQFNGRQRILFDSDNLNLYGRVVVKDYSANPIGSRQTIISVERDSSLDGIDNFLYWNEDEDIFSIGRNARHVRIRTSSGVRLEVDSNGDTFINNNLNVSGITSFDSSTYHSGHIELAAQKFIFFEDGKHNINNNDGSGNFNIKVGMTADASRLCTEVGYGSHWTFTQSTGEWTFYATDYRQVDSAYSLTEVLSITPTGITGVFSGTGVTQGNSKIEVVSALPGSPDANTLYLIV